MKKPGSVVVAGRKFKNPDKVIRKLRTTVKKLGQSLQNLENKFSSVQEKTNRNIEDISKHSTKISEVFTTLADFAEDVVANKENIRGIGEEVKLQISEVKESIEKATIRSGESEETVNDSRKGNEEAALFKCTPCDLTFHDKEHLVYHQELLHNPQPFACNLCPRKFGYQRHLTSHLIAHEKRKFKPVLRRAIECELCHKVFASNSTLRNHQRVHDIDRKFECHICDRSFKRKDHLQHHVRAHLDPMSFSCETCRQSFSRVATLREHTKSVHGRSKRARYECPLCPATFIYKRSAGYHLKVHRRAAATADEPFVCDKCGRMFANRQQLGAHSRSHRKEAPKKCTICNIHFSRPYGLQRHQQLKHCGGQTESSSSPTRPDREGVVTPEKARKPSERASVANTKSLQDQVEPHLKRDCDLCKKSFSRTDAYRRHRKLIHPELPPVLPGKSGPRKSGPRTDFKCMSCQKRFSDSVALNKHITRAHQYTCSFCQQSFIKWPEFQEHIRSSHAQDMTVVKPGAEDAATQGCKLCSKSFRAEELFLQHLMDTHAWSKPYKCHVPNCNLSFTTISAKKTHQAKHNKDVVNTADNSTDDNDN